MTAMTGTGNQSNKQTNKQTVASDSQVQVQVRICNQ